VAMRMGVLLGLSRKRGGLGRGQMVDRVPMPRSPGLQETCGATSQTRMPSHFPKCGHLLSDRLQSHRSV
jgi:hypothetical protein